MISNKTEVLIRINSRITPDQHKFFKAEAKRLKIKEGEMHRIAFDFYIQKHEKN